MTVILRRLPTEPREPAGEFPAWQAPKAWALEHRVSIACVRCGNGHWATLSPQKKVGNELQGHLIDADGTVRPSLVCPEEGCGWHHNGRLEDWEPGCKTDHPFDL